MIGFVYGLIIEQFGWTVYIVLAGFAVSCVVSFFVLRYLLYLWGRNNVCKYIVNPRSFSFLLLYTRQFHQFLHIVVVEGPKQQATLCIFLFLPPSWPCLHGLCTDRILCPGSQLFPRLVGSPARSLRKISRRRSTNNSELSLPTCSYILLFWKFWILLQQWFSQ